MLTPIQIRTRAAKRALAVRGMMEAVTWSFIPAAHARLFGGGSDLLKLANPIAADMSDMRPSLLPGLIALLVAVVLSAVLAWIAGTVVRRVRGTSPFTPSRSMKYVG